MKETGAFFIGGVGTSEESLRRVANVFEKRIGFDTVGMHLPDWSIKDGIDWKARQLVDAYLPFKGDVRRVLRVEISAAQLLSQHAARKFPELFEEGKHVAVCSRVRMTPATDENNELFRANPDYEEAVRSFEQQILPSLGERDAASLLIFGGHREDRIAPPGSYEIEGIEPIVVEDQDYRGHEQSIGRILSTQGLVMRKFLLAA